MANHIRASLSHHLLRVESALIDRNPDSLFRRDLEAHAALLEYVGDDRVDLLPELRVRRGFVQDVKELLVRTLKASWQLVWNELGGHVVGVHLWSVVCVSWHTYPLGMGF